MIGSGVAATRAGYLTVWQDRSAFVSAFIAPFFFVATLLVLTTAAAVWFFVDDRATALTYDDLIRAGERSRAVSIAVNALAAIAIGIGLNTWSRRGSSIAADIPARTVAIPRLLAGVALAWSLDKLIDRIFLTLWGFIPNPSWYLLDVLGLVLVAGVGFLAAAVLVTLVEPPGNSFGAIFRSLVLRWRRGLAPGIVAFALVVLPAVLVIAAVSWAVFVRFPGGLWQDVARGGMAGGLIVSAAVQYVRNLLEWMAAAYVGAASIAALHVLCGNADTTPPADTRSAA